VLIAQSLIQWSYVTGQWGQIQADLIQHIELSLIALGFGLVISQPLALLAWRFRPLRVPVVGLASALYVIPSLALFAILGPITGYVASYPTALIALVGYTLLILIWNTMAGLDAVPDDTEVIVVHDGARPLASAALFRSVVDAVAGGASGAVPGVPLTDTVKRVDDDGAVVSTVPRHGLVTVQTPQAFRADVLRRAHATGDDATDDAGLVEAQGATVRVVPGDPRNVKVTTPADLDTARALVGA